jgi:hypothetical protein
MVRRRSSGVWGTIYSRRGHSVDGEQSLIR